MAVTPRERERSLQFLTHRAELTVHIHFHVTRRDVLLPIHLDHLLQATLSRGQRPRDHCVQVRSYPLETITHIHLHVLSRDVLLSVSFNQLEHAILGRRQRIRDRRIEILANYVQTLAYERFYLFRRRLLVSPGHKPLHFLPDALWSQLEDAWTPSGKGWERSYPRQYCHEVFSLSMSANPTGLWDWEKLHPSTVDAPEVTLARTKIVDLWKQHVLATMNVSWRWRNGMHDEDNRWSDDQASAIHIGAIRTETQCLQRDPYQTRASRRLGWNILKKLKTQSILERDPRSTDRATTRYILYFNGHTDQKSKRSRAGTVMVKSTETATEADIVWSTSMSLPGTTNNQVMYEGLIAGLKEAQKKGWTPLEVAGSSSLVHQQMSKYKPPRKKRLLGFYAVARRLEDSLGVRHWHHHQSEFNRMARAAATHEATTRTSAATLHPTDRPGTTTLTTYLSGDHARWQSNYWSRTLAVN